MAQGANEIRAFAPGITAAYAVVREIDGDVWYVSGQVFEDWGTGGRNAADYDLGAMTDEKGDMLRDDMDTNISAGFYHIVTYYMVGGSPADTDPAIWVEYGYWDGTSTWTPGSFSHADIESEVNDALVALNLDHLMKTAVASNADMTTEVTDGTVLSNIMTSDSDTSGYVVADDSLEAISDAVNAVPTAAAIADAVWDELSAGHTDAGKAGQQQWTDVDAILTDTGTTIPGTITTAQTDLDTITGGSGVLIDTDAVDADAIKTDAVTEIQAGLATATNVTTAHSNTDALINALNDLSAAEVNAEADTALSDYDGPTNTEMLAAHSTTDGLINGLNDLSAAEVNAEADTALSDYDPPTRAEATADKDAVLAAIAALNNITAAEVWAATVEGAYDFKDFIRLMASTLFGKVSGGGTTNIVFRDIGDTKDRVDVTVDAMGNRTSVTLDAD
jgi:hypothetical protein